MVLSSQGSDGGADAIPELGGCRSSLVTTVLAPHR
jgi:hypothetical protein